ncbi:MAG: c-type cytochrome [Kofleriaceae bacterium]|nr:c-type cytochrome [Myxococcales bacterium]MCB9565343.1 c-type cytochrome [Kofleriaceae bacterium]
MSRTDEERLMAHEYDGIREYDNPLPGWWKGIFVLSIVWAIGYWLYFHGGPGKLPKAQFDADWKSYTVWKAEAEKKVTFVASEESLARLAADPATIEQGKKVFATNCVACHTENGRGNIGANLTDDYQIHGTTRLDIYNTIHDGVPEKGMISWGPTLHPKDLAAVAAYVSTLRNTNVPDGKAHEGAHVDPFPR